MKKICVFLLLFLALYVQAVAQKENTTKEPKGKILFKQPSFDFGEIRQGTVVEHTFEFENVGNAPIIITDIRTTCGCTATKWSKQPIAAGEKSSITAQFNSAGKIGMQNKVITIISNAANEQERISIKVNVLGN